MKIGVFASGGGSNFTAIHSKILEGLLNVEVSFLLTNNSKCGAAEYAHHHGIPVVHISSKTHPESETYDQAVLQACLEVDLIVLAGFMKKLPDQLIANFPNKIINIHPALLPSFGGHGFYGSRVHQAAYDAGVKFSGMTIHFVNEVYDTGQIIYQATTPITFEDQPEDIGTKVLRLEHQHYWQVVKSISESKLQFSESGRVQYLAEHI